LDPVPEVEETPNQAYLTTIDFANSVEPADRQPVEQGGRTIRFELFLSQLVPDAQLAEYESGRLQVNFIAMNRAERGDEDDRNVKVWTPWEIARLRDSASTCPSP
jgi:hypothetical protein